MQIPLIGGARAMARTQNDSQKEHWPYWWEYCPSTGKEYALDSTIAAPANATQTEIFFYTVPDGYQFVAKGIILDYEGTPYVDGLNLVSWQFDVNIPTSIGAGVTAPIMPSGHIVPYFGGVDTSGQPTGSIKIHRGSFDRGQPFPIQGRMVFDPRDQIRIKVTTTAPFPTVGVFFKTMLSGWTVPV